MRNYLRRLGWSHGDDEIFSTEQAIAWFDIDDINKSPGRLDFAKLGDVNSHYIRQASDDELIRRIRELLPELPDGAEIAAKIERVGWDRLAKALPSLKERAKTLNDLVAGAGYLLASAAACPRREGGQAPRCGGKNVKCAIAALLSSSTDWNAKSLEACDPRIRGKAWAEAWQSCTATARRANRPGGVAPRVRRHGGPRDRTEALKRLRDEAG